MGLARDMALRLNSPRKFLNLLVNTARRLIYDKGVGIGGAAIEDLLKPTSSVPTMVCFCDK